MGFWKKNSNAGSVQAVDLSFKQGDPGLYVGLLESTLEYYLGKAVVGTAAIDIRNSCMS